jgi:hypothetical protein
MKRNRGRAANMNSYETTATVEDNGRVHLAGVPFAPGTEVAVTICEKVGSDTKSAAADEEQRGVRMKDLFARVRARNTESIGPLRREELYDREVFR